MKILNFKNWNRLNEQLAKGAMVGTVVPPKSLTAIVRDSSNGNDIANTKATLFDGVSYSVDTHKLNISKEIKKVHVFFMLDGFGADVKSEFTKKSKNVGDVTLSPGEQLVLQDVDIRQPGALDGNSWAGFNIGGKELSFSIWNSGGKPQGV